MFVTGPTPPGTGVIAPATGSALSKSTSPRNFPVDDSRSDVDHGRARFEVFAAN